MEYRKTLNILLIGFILSFCFAQAQSSEHTSFKYQQAEALYLAKKYDKALQILEVILPLLQGKKELIQAQFYHAFALFYEAAYSKSAHCFKEFYTAYPKRPEAEAALYMQAYALYHLMPESEFDQTATDEALAVFGHYLEKYPEGIYQENSLQCLKKLQANLAYKAFLNVKLYYELGYYQAAVVASKNFQIQFPRAQEILEANYLKLKAQDKLVESTQDLDQASNLRSLVIYCQEFLDNYPQNIHSKEVQYIYRNTLIKITQLSKLNRYN